MAVGAGLYMYEIVVNSSRLLSHLLMSSFNTVTVSMLLFHLYHLMMSIQHAFGSYLVSCSQQFFNCRS